MSNISVSPSTTGYRHRFHLLDGLRGIAAIIVVLWHTPRNLWGSNASHNGPLAVDFFFCLSGFVIAFSYEQRLRDGLSIFAFAAARLIRLYPVYLLGALWGFAMAIALSMERLHGLPQNSLFLALAIFLLPNPRQHWSFLLYPLNSPSWSLFYELLANFAFAYLVWKRKASNILIGWIGLCSLVLLAANMYRGHTLWQLGWQCSVGSFFLGFARIGISFTIGILLQRFYRGHRYQLSGGLRMGIAVLLTCLLCFVMTTRLPLFTTEAFDLFAICVLLPAVVGIGAYANPPEMFTGVCVFLGEISYPTYLLHMPVIFWLSHSQTVFKWLARDPEMTRVLAPIMLSVIVMSAWITARYIDAPIRKYLTAQFAQKESA